MASIVIIFVLVLKNGLFSPVVLGFVNSSFQVLKNVIGRMLFDKNLFGIGVIFDIHDTSSFDVLNIVVHFFTIKNCSS